MDFFLQYKQIFVTSHLIGFAIGFGGAIISDYLFFRFLKNFKLSNYEIYILGAVSKMVWAGLFILIISGIGIFYSDPQTYLNSSKFLIKMLVVLVITLNGINLHFYVKPRLKLIDWEKINKSQKNRRLRKIAFASGAISITSWLLATTLGSLKSIPLNLLEAVLAYIGVLTVAVAGSLFVERIYKK